MAIFDFSAISHIRNVPSSSVSENTEEGLQLIIWYTLAYVMQIGLQWQIRRYIDIKIRIHTDISNVVCCNIVIFYNLVIVIQNLKI